MTTSEEVVADDAGTMKGVEMMGFHDILDRKRYVVERLEVVSIPDVAKKGSKPSSGNRKKTMKTSAATSRKESDAVGIEKVPFTPKTDTHWDFVMKEMMWLGADFQAERKRQRSLAKKCAASVRQYHRTKEARRLRELAQADAKRRKLAARAGREVKAWWNKLDKIIAFKQKMKADEEREMAMNKQLVVLVQQTEKYTESLATYTVGDTSTEDDCSEMKSLSELEEDGEAEGQSTVDEIGGGDRKTSRRKTKLRKRYRMTIEEALASEHRRKSKSRVVDYARMKVDSTEFYGESTASDASGSDDTFSEPDVSDDSDDDSTLRTAMREELEERNKMISKSSQTNQPFFPDPEEVTKLQEEQTMDIQQVINRLQDESSELESSLDEPAAKRVKFAESINDIPVMYLSRKVDPGEEADDDGDASDVEEYDADDFSDEEYEVGEIEVDDETTIAQEESLPTEMAYDEEIGLLRKSAEIPIEELRKMYANLQAQHEGKGSICSELKRSSSESVGDDTTDEDDYVAGEPEMDDEITIAQEESLPQDVSYSEEIDLLKQGAEVPIEELRRMYAHLSSGTDNEEVKKTDGGSSSASDEDGAYEESAVHEVDDETTIEAEERLGRDMTYEEELSALHRDNMMSVEELRAIYGSLDENHLPRPSKESMIVEEGDAESNAQKRAREKDDSSGSEMDVELDDGVAALNALEASAEKACQTLASRPFLLAPWVKLRMYQQVGLNWLVSLQARRLNGILADEMGLGKTLQTISLLAYLASYKGIWGPHLVVVPTSVIINWETELKRFCPGLKVLCYYGSAKRRKELRTGWTKTNWYHVVITSYQLAVQDAFAFKRKKWYYLILDEAQNIKNFQSQRWQTLINFNTQRRLLLTGTPLQNSLMELWSLLHFLMPYIFKSRKEFSYWFSNPMNSMIEGTVKRNDDVIKRLHGIIRPFVLRRLKKDVETQMPGKYEHVVKCKLSRRQMTLYEEFLSRSSTRQALKKGGNFMGMMNVLMQLRKVCNHPDLFEPRSVVTPFVISNIRLLVPRCVGILEKRKEEAMDKISENLFQPLWTGSSGQPSLEAALRHNLVEAQELHRLRTQRDPKLLSFKDEKIGPEELRTTLAEIYVARRQVIEAQILFQNNLNRRRCYAPSFIYSSACQEAVDIETSVLHRRGPVEIQRSRPVEIPSPLLALCKSELQRSEDLEETIEKFVFCVPSAGALPITMDDGGLSTLPFPKSVERMLLEPVEELLLPYRKAFARLSSFFPDKKLVQYDAGKLQTLAELLRTLKHGGHRALIFTQMSKMLDILEVFLNIHGFTYLRLDGATGVDRRQRYMDRFNNDSKIFCFILSTRSGGMGINLTGADTVIFYDSDWNPAMDAQAQDRAHRIGQTRDVHIYRLITEHTIEENILSKAKQKKNLDILVMDQGNFDASSRKSMEESKSTVDDGIKDVYTKKGLQAILGVTEEDQTDEIAPDGDIKHLSIEQMEMAMTSLEDEDDVRALRGAQQEAADELREFDENVEFQKASDDEDDRREGGSGKEQVQDDVNASNPADDLIIDVRVDENDLEKEFAAWQSSDGFDRGSFETSLSPMERYGLRFHENIDPFYSIFFINEERRRMESTDGGSLINIEELEREKAMEERQAMEDGDLLSTNIKPEELIRQRNLYRREKARLRSDKKSRQLKGEDWSQRVDGLTQQLFWYNEDTGEAVWDTPRVVTELQEHDVANKEGWSKLPMVPLVRVMSFLSPFPDRQSCSIVCQQWRMAANDIRFVRHVYPVEMGALAQESNRRDHNHFLSISDAVDVALPGDTIELSDGHYYINEPGLIVDKPLKLVGDENNPANVVIELSGSIQWSGTGGWIEGITFRRPKIVSGITPTLPMLEMKDKSKISMIHSVFDNEPSLGCVVALSGTGNKGDLYGIIIRNGGSDGIQMNGQIHLKLTNCTLRGNVGNGIVIDSQSSIELRNCKISENKGYGVRFAKGSKGIILSSHFAGNAKGVLYREMGCNISCSSNTARVSASPGKQIPGFKVTYEANLTPNVDE